MVTQTDIFVLKTDGKKPIVTEFSPIREPLKVCAGLAEKFKFHLLKFAHSENKVSGSYLITERLTYLSYTERKLFTCGSLHVYKVRKDTLRCLGTEINRVLCILGDALECLEHKVKLANISKVVLSTRGTRNIVLLNEILHLCIGECVNGLLKLKSRFCAIVFDKLVRAESLVALAAVHKRIRKSRKVTRRNPRLRVHKNSCVKTYVILVFLNEFLPPSLLYVVLKLNAKRAVVPSVCKSTVYLGSGEYKTSVFGEGNYFVHCLFCISHILNLPCRKSFVGKYEYQSNYIFYHILQ